MLYIWIEDWSRFAARLHEKGLPNNGVVFKVLCSEDDPRKIYDRESIAVFEGKGEPFDANDVFSYGERGAWDGQEIEEYISSWGLSEKGNRFARALFRFANKPELNFTQASMSLHNAEGRWLIDHPLQEIDGLEKAQLSPEKEREIHLDIFVSNSVKALGRVLEEMTEGVESPVVSFDERRELLRREYEIRRYGKER